MGPSEGSRSTGLRPSARTSLASELSHEPVLQSVRLSGRCVFRLSLQPVMSS